MKKTDFVDLEELKKVNSKVNILENKVNEKEKRKDWKFIRRRENPIL